MENRVKVLIVDDEPAARQLLSTLLSDFADIDEVGQAKDVDEAIQLTRTLQPDLVFLDVEMPGKNGFEFIKEMKVSGLKVSVIFITAYDKYALEAFKHYAVHYLLKPPSPIELREAIDRFKQERNKEELFSKLELLSNELFHSKLRFSTANGYVLVDPAEIVFCEAEGNYSFVHLLNGRKEVVSYQLGVLEQKINSSHFIRINRSCLVNSDFLRSINRRKRMALLSYDHSDISLPVSSECMKKIRNNFSD